MKTDGGGLWWMSGLLIAGLAIGGCQSAVRVGAANHCGEVVEVRASEIPVDEDSTPWVDLDEGERDTIVMITEDARILYIAVRIESRPIPTSYAIPVGSLGRPDEASDYDLEVALGGENCSPVLDGEDLPGED